MIFNREDVNRRINNLRTDVDSLLQHRMECDVLHEQHKEHRKRHDDAMNNLTESNMMLAKSITSMDVTLNRLVTMVESDQPDIKIIKNARIAWDINKTLFFGIAAFAVAVMSIIAAYNYFW